MVLVVLAVAWGTVLVFWLRSRRQGAFSDSVGLFHRHLRVLERTAPSTLAAANRMRGPLTSSLPLSAVAGNPTGLSGPRRTIRPDARPQGVRRPQDARRASMARMAPAANVSAARRRQAKRRRRDVLFALLSLALITLVLALGTGSHMLLLVQLAADTVVVAYMALLVRLRNQAAERDMKLRVLHTPTRSAGYGAVYGDLALRRVAN